MMPIGPLMIEHRLIERMIALLRRELERLDSGGEMDPAFIETAVDFIRTYADRCHHGKEEDILFRDLAGKRLSDEHRKTMDELIAEHVVAREATAGLTAAAEDCAGGNAGALDEVKSRLRELVELYPAHIEKEDRRFFIPCMSYFDDGERAEMLREMREFGRQMIHEKYRKVVEGLKG